MHATLKRFAAEDTAVEQQVRRTRMLRPAAIAGDRLFQFASVIGQEGGDLLGDRRVGFVRQADVLEPRGGLSLGSIGPRRTRERNRRRSGCRVSSLVNVVEIVPPISELPRPSTEIVCSSGPSADSNCSFASRQACHSETLCQGSRSCPCCCSRVPT